MVEDGYYWVIFNDNPIYGNAPIIAEWSSGSWWFIGSDEPGDADDVRIVSDRICI